MTSVIFSDSYKGGTGKSVTSLVMADWLIERVDPVKVLLVESDMLTSDVRPHFSGSGIRSLLVDMASDTAGAVGCITEAVASGEHDYIVVNMSARVAGAMQEHMDCVGGVFRNVPCDFRVAWSMGNSLGNLENLRDAQEKGLLSMCLPSNRILLLPEMLGSRETFGDISFFEGAVAVMPELTPDNVAQPAFNAPTPLRPLCQKEIGAANRLNSLARAILNRWIKAAREALKPIFPELEV